MSRVSGLVGVVGFVVCAVLGTAAPVGAEPALPPLASTERVAGIRDPGYSGDGRDAIEQ